MVQSHLVILATLLLSQASCAQPVSVRDERAFEPVGVWQGADGFSLKIAPNNQYVACSYGSCAGGSYFSVTPDRRQLVLKGFMKLPITKAFIESSEAFDHSAEVCSPKQSDQILCRDDLVFFDSVAPQDAASRCGKRECTIIGNRDTTYGTLYKVAPTDRL